MSGNVLLEFSNVVKRYGETAVVDGISFTVAPGEFFTLLGPSGCGKTTTLRLLAGLETPDAGEIALQGRTLAAPARNILVPIDKRNMGMVFQSYAIWPHLTVFENVAFPLRVRGESRATIRKRVLEALEVVGLTGFADRGSTELSGGQQQRVALARAIVYTPALLLLDEPLSNLDVKLREQMREELHALHKRLNLAVVYVTHDQAEALALSDRIAVVNQGKLEQVGSPVEVYEHPRTRFVGDFLGRTIILKGTMHKAAGQSVVDVQGAGRVMVNGDVAFGEGAGVRILSRPEDISLLPAGELAPNQVVGKVEHIAYMGDHLEYTIEAAGRTLLMPASKRENHAIGASVRLVFDPSRVTALPQ
ncbi:MAG TPA: ABC transporter ATP-binding protein [Xanthobacteraceae bacterium]|nr:ABC transporter ATP-binding protein [Xanthobacteraceae bacterium]